MVLRKAGLFSEEARPPSDYWYDCRQKKIPDLPGFLNISFSYWQRVLTLLESQQYQLESPR
jgi:hypothetical protein